MSAFIRRILAAASFGTPGTAQVLPATRLGGPMPWVIAIMVALTVLAAGGALALANFVKQTRAELEGGMTVQIMEDDPGVRAALVQRIAAAVRAEAPGADVRIVPESELARLVEPWLGGLAASEAVTLPALIELKLEGGADAATLTRLRDTLARVAPTARLDRQADWLGPVFDAISALRWLALALIALLTLASAASVWLAARNALDANRETIEIVHHLGGDDAQISGIFQRSVLIDAALGGALGLVFGAIALALVGTRFAALQSGMVESGSLSALDWLLIVCVPVVTTVVALITARRTVMARLGRML